MIIDLEKKKLELKPKNALPVQTHRSKKTRYCLHRSVLVDDNARTVECSKCGANLDPFAVLLTYARDGDRLRWMYLEIQQANKTIEELKAEERRVKARLRNARKKGA